ncbi:MAG: hypothetical protein HY897_26245 [Deltaproteobacteria bacterium]|nr:hypothetical protein [Deltaproteobacteria bacterium]
MSPPLPPGGGVAFNAWGVELLTPFGPVLAAAAAFLAIAGLALSLRGLHTFLLGWQRAALAVLRTAAVLAALAVFLEPAVVYKKVSRVRSRVAVLADTSSSMALPASAGGPTRGDVVAAWTRRSAGDLQELSARYVLSYHTFDADVRQVAADAAAQAAASPAGRGTDVLRAIDAVAGGEVPLSAIIVLTDGADRADLVRAFDGSSGAFRDPVSGFLRNLGAPVHVFIPGSDAAAPDVAVSSLSVPHVAFTGVETDLGAIISAGGFGGAEIPVTLRSGGQVIQTRTVRIAPGRPEQRVAFSLTPSKAAAGVVSVSAPVLSSDVEPENNTAHAVLRVVRDRTRVLQVAGGPSWDVRFLRQFLKKSPGVDLISFFILRTLESQVNAPDDELSLIPFPTDEVFRGHIETFDVVVFQDFNFSPYGMHGYLPGLARFVENGGGLLVVGGNRSLSTGEYRASAIDHVLPVTLGAGDSAVSTDAFQPVLTAAGEVHPVTALGADPAGCRALWRNTPAMNGLNVAAAVRVGASVLLAHPFLKSGDQPAPLLAVREHGRGRVAVLMTDESWRFEFSEAAFGESRLYRLFYDGMLRWLAGDPAFERVRVDDAITADPGAPPALRGAVRGADFRPVPEAAVRVSLRPTDDRVSAGAAGGPPSLEGSTGPDGRFALPAAGVPPGAYAAELTVTKNGAEIARASREIIIDTRDPEKTVPHPNIALMKALAAASGGAVHFVPKDSLSSLRLPDRAREVVDKKEHRPLWDRAWIIPALCLTLAAEWFLRRRWGQQ